MADDPLAAFRTPGSTAPTPPESGTAARHRSVADGELASAWTLGEFFNSLNTVMRLPVRPRRKKDQAKDAPHWMDRVSIPRPLIVGSFALLAVVLVARPLMSAAVRASKVDLTPVLGVWQAKEGRYAGRLFEVTPVSIAFHTSSKSPDYTWHKIDGLRMTPAGDSTLYTVTYEQEGKTADFAFWLIPSRNPVIRFKNVPAVNWDKTPLPVMARPR